jgi:death-on-curing protein
MPQSTFAGNFLHGGVAEMAAAYHYHLCSNHPFLDGNKRVAVAAAEIFLLSNRNELIASDDELAELTLGVARGHMSKEAVITFFKRHTSAV